jgi:hypothetical protein
MLWGRWLHVFRFNKKPRPPGRGFFNELGTHSEHF